MKTQTLQTSSTRGKSKIAGLVVVGAVLLATVNTGLAAESAATKDLGLFYQQNCARCHGVTGNARDAAGKPLRGADFTKVKWQQNANDTAMAKIIRNGIFFGLVMPSFKSQLTQDESLLLVRDILHKQFGTNMPK